MKLNELHVFDLCANRCRKPNSIARCNWRIRGVTINLTAASRCQKRRSGLDANRVLAFRTRNRTAAPRTFQQQTFDKRKLSNRDVGLLPRCVDQSAFDFPTRLVGPSNDPVSAVASLSS